MFRVVWQYANNELNRDFYTELSGPNKLLASTAPEFAGFELLSAPEPVFLKHPLGLRGKFLSLFDAGLASHDLDLASYFHAFVANQEAANRLVSMLRARSDIAYADVQPRIKVPVRFGSNRKEMHTYSAPFKLPPEPTPDLVSEQGYLHPAPQGIDATFAHSLPGGQGDGVRVIDIEFGWNFGHEDLLSNQGGIIFGAANSSDHGTAVLGIISGDPNGFGITGIAPNAGIAAAAAIYDDELKKWNAAAAIIAAVDRLHVGDVILLEMHAPGPHATGKGQEGYIPIEFWQCEYAAIRYAVSKGIHVIEAAGNGGEDLDHEDYRRAFNRAQRDSGAIMVGGGNSALSSYPRSRIHWSNYGARVDVQGWGNDIVTSGGREHPAYYSRVDNPDPSRCYTQNFGGTSGASPIVVGAVACISSYMRSVTRRLSPSEMRQLLIETGSPQEDAPDFPRTHNIGPLPNIRRALSRLGLATI